MPRRWYYNVIVTSDGVARDVYTNEAAEKIVEFIKKSKLVPVKEKSESED
jgi:hypothetical protein